MQIWLGTIALVLFGLASSLFPVEGIIPPVPKENPPLPAPKEPIINPQELNRFFIDSSKLPGKNPAFKPSLNITLSADFKLKGGLGAIYEFARNNMFSISGFSVERNRDFSKVLNLQAKTSSAVKLEHSIITARINAEFTKREFEFPVRFHGENSSRWVCDAVLDGIVLRGGYSTEFSLEGFYGTKRDDYNWYPVYSAKGDLLFRYYLPRGFRAKSSIQLGGERIRDTMNGYLVEYAKFRAYCGLGYTYNVHYFELGFHFNTTYSNTYLFPYARANIRTTKWEILAEYTGDIELPARSFISSDPIISSAIFLDETVNNYRANLETRVYLTSIYEAKIGASFNGFKNTLATSLNALGNPIILNLTKSDQILSYIDISANHRFFSNTLRFTYNRFVDQAGFQIPLVARLTLSEILEIKYKDLLANIKFNLYGRRETFGGNYFKPYATVDLSAEYGAGKLKFGIKGTNIFNEKYPYYPGLRDCGSQMRLELIYGI